MKFLPTFFIKIVTNTINYGKKKYKVDFINMEFCDKDIDKFIVKLVFIKISIY